MSAAAASAAPAPTPKSVQPLPHIAIVVDGNDGARSGFLASFPVEYLEHLTFFIQTALLVRLAQYGLPVGDFNPPAGEDTSKPPAPYKLHPVKVVRHSLYRGRRPNYQCRRAQPAKGPPGSRLGGEAARHEERRTRQG
jgi:hypothetical protein